MNEERLLRECVWSRKMVQETLEEMQLKDKICEECLRKVMRWFGIRRPEFEEEIKEWEGFPPDFPIS